MPCHPNSSSIRPALLVLLALLAQYASAIHWSSPRTGDIISPGDMVLAAWEAEKNINSPILRLCSQGAGDREADCSVLGSSEFSHRKNGDLATLLLVPESVSPGKSYFQVELAGEVYDSPHFSVLKSIQQLGAVSNPRPPATENAQDPKATTPLIEFITQTIVDPVPSSSQEIDISTSPAILPSLASPSWLPRLPAKPVVRLDSPGPNVVGLVVVVMTVLFALAAIGALVATLRRRCKGSRQLNVMNSYGGEPKTDDRLTRLPSKKTVQYLPNLHSLGIHTVSEGQYSNGDSRRISLEDVRLTPRIPFPSPKGMGDATKGH